MNLGHIINLVKNKWVLFLLIGTLSLSSLPSWAASPQKVDFRITHYRVTLRVEPKKKRLVGRVSMELHSLKRAFSELVFPLDKQKIIRAFGPFGKIHVTRKGRFGYFKFVGTLPAKKSHQITVDYEVTKTQGLVFQKNLVYTAFHTCKWMICQNHPGHKATLRMEIIAPRHWKVFASGKHAKTKLLSHTLRSHSWRLNRPYSPYLFGFIAGRWVHVKERIRGTVLHYYGQNITPKKLKKVFSDMRHMLRFFRYVAGTNLPIQNYRQFLVDGSVAQEVSHYSLLGKRFVLPILKHPQEDWLIVHELAHQWWGNSITCRTWADFWLNEGLVTFLVAAYKERRWGRKAYQREQLLAKKRYAYAQRKKFDVPLHFKGKYPSLRIKRAIAYHKGALFFFALRKQIGDAAFWKGIQLYTLRHLGKSVTSKDLQAAFETVTKKKLTHIFQKWVFGNKKH